MFFGWFAGNIFYRFVQVVGCYSEHIGIVGYFVFGFVMLIEQLFERTQQVICGFDKLRVVLLGKAAMVIALNQKEFQQ